MSEPRASLFAVRRVNDVPFAGTSDSPLLADVYLPEDLRRPAPVIIWLHGGAWRFGDRRLAPDLARIYASRGFAMVSIDYRLSADAIFPAAVEDVKTAIRWVRHVAGTYGFDRTAIGLFGSSAGGHLGALAGLSMPGTFESPTSLYAGESSRVQAVVDGYGPTDFLQIDAHRLPDGAPSDDPETIRLPPGLRTAHATSPESLWLGGPVETRHEAARAANPLTYVSADAPPFLILHGLSDPAVPWHQSQLLFDALECADATATLALVAGLGHGFLNRSHLDDGAPWSMTVRTHARGSATRVESVTRAIFPMIEDFFRTELLKA